MKINSYLIYILLIIIFIIISIILLFLFKNKDASYQNRVIYVIRTHVLDKTFFNLWTKCIKELPNENIYVMYDNTNNTLTYEFYQTYKKHLIIITQDESKLLNSLHDTLWYSADTAISKCSIFFKTNNIAFDYMWLIENDVYCDGNIYNTLQKVEHMKEDFLATQVSDYSPDNSDWHWWNNIVGDINISNDNRVKSLFPVTRYSSKFIDVIESNLGKISGYCEVYIPTLAKIENLSYGNLPDTIIGNLQWLLLDEIKLQNDDKLYHKYIFEKTKLIC